MKLSIIVIIVARDIPRCMSIQDIQEAMERDDHLQELKMYIIGGWLDT